MSYKKVLLALSIAVLAIAVVSGSLAGAYSSGAETDNALAGAVTSAPESDVVGDILIPAMGYYAKYDGIDGESTSDTYTDWIDILSIEWGAQQPDSGVTGMSRRRLSPEIEDFVITFLYEKSAPKLAEKCLKGMVIPKLEVELAIIVNDTTKHYLRYELKNVMIQSYHVSGTAENGIPIVSVANSFEEIKVTYTEYAPNGSPMGNIEFTYKVE